LAKQAGIDELARAVQPRLRTVRDTSLPRSFAVAYDNSQKFSFEIQGFPRDTFLVIRFQGEEALAKLYQFDVSLYCTDDEGVDFDKVFSGDAALTILRPDGDVTFHGIVTSFEQREQTGQYTVYQARLSPKHWWLTQAEHNKIFLDRDVRDFLAESFKGAGLIEGADFEFRLMRSYPVKQYVCQYNETCFAFMSRWLERDGMYYYFEHGDFGVKMVVTDVSSSHLPMPHGKTLSYSPPSGLDADLAEETVSRFTLTQVPVAGTVVLKDYNYRTPSLDLECSARIDSGGNGAVCIYGEHYQTRSEGEALASVRAEAIACRRRLFGGESSVPYVRPGYTFELKKHYRGAFNREYLAIEVLHEGSQEAYLTNGLGLELAGSAGEMFYRNTFTAIASDVQFRSQRLTPRPRLSGTLNAKIDAAGTGEYAEVDSQGRYKVIMPFDLSGRDQGRATAWLRMAQPYAGADHGMHFPLHKGTEVLILCVDGDPDRPIIASAVSNPETPSPVTDANQTMAMVTTAGQNKIHMQDQEGSQRILMQTPTANTWLRLGAPNDPPPDPGDPEPAEVNGATIYTADGWGVYAGTRNEVIFGESAEFVAGADISVSAILDVDLCLGSKNDMVVGFKTDLIFGGVYELCLPSHTRFSPAVTKLEAEVAALREIQTDLIMDHTKLSSQVNTLAGDTSKLAFATSELVSRTSKLAAQSSRLAVEVNELAASSSHVHGDKADMIAQKTQTIGNRIENIAENMQNVASNVFVAGDHMASMLTSTEVALEKTNIGDMLLL
jgi:type VI secretion system secreted protein VgrG